MQQSTREETARKAICNMQRKQNKIDLDSVEFLDKLEGPVSGTGAYQWAQGRDSGHKGLSAGIRACTYVSGVGQRNELRTLK